MKIRPRKCFQRVLENVSVIVIRLNEVYCEAENTESDKGLNSITAWPECEPDQERWRSGGFTESRSGKQISKRQRDHDPAVCGRLSWKVNWEHW